MLFGEHKDFQIKREKIPNSPNTPTPGSVCGQHPWVRAALRSPVVFLLHVRPFAQSKAEAAGSPTKQRIRRKPKITTFFPL